MKSAVRLDARLTERVHLYGELPAPGEALRILRAAEMLVLDGVPWHADLDVVRAGLIAKRRGPAEPFGGLDASPAVMAEVGKLAEQADALRVALYELPCTALDVMFRPMVSGPEPMHFDTFDDSGGCWISAFINVAATPRKYCLGPSLPSLDPSIVHEVVREGEAGKGFSYLVRERTMAGRPPLDAGAPRHELDLAPGAIWFFNSKTVSHELLHGEGAVSIGWLVPGAAPTQAEVLKAMR